MSDTLIDALASPAGWTADSGITIESQGFKDYISGYNDASLALRVTAGHLGASATKTIAFDATGKEWISFSAISLRRPVAELRRSSDAAYSIELASGQVFYVPIRGDFSRVFIPVDGFTGVTRFKITVRHNDDDFLMISNLRAVSDDFPADVLAGVKSGLERERDRLAPGIPIGTVTASAGARSVTVATDWSWVERNVVLRIGSGATAEEHLINNVSGNVVSFADTLDGAAILHNHTTDAAFITFPVDVGYYDREAKLPGVSLWYQSPTPIPRNGREGLSVVAIGPLGVYQRRDGALVRWHITFEAAARAPELVAIATEAIRAYLATSAIWVHGQRLWFEWAEPSVDSEPVEGYDIVPRASYAFDVEVKEDSWQLQKVVTGSPSLSVSPSA